MKRANIEIKRGGLSHPGVVALLREHLEEMASHTPAESVHALDLVSLQHSDISFWTAWSGDALAGCAAIKKLDTHSAELKSMRTCRNHRRTGVASQLLTHLIKETKKRNFKTLYLETGSIPAFAAAAQLYQKFGFIHCKPFADYIEDPNSVFMVLQL